MNEMRKLMEMFDDDDLEGAENADPLEWIASLAEKGMAAKTLSEAKGYFAQILDETENHQGF
jgi:hypothetical protein